LGVPFLRSFFFCFILLKREWSTIRRHERQFPLIYCPTHIHLLLPRLCLGTHRFTHEPTISQQADSPPPPTHTHSRPHTRTVTTRCTHSTLAVRATTRGSTCTHEALGIRSAPSSRPVMTVGRAARGETTPPPTHRYFPSRSSRDLVAQSSSHSRNIACACTTSPLVLPASAFSISHGIASLAKREHSLRASLISGVACTAHSQQNCARHQYADTALNSTAHYTANSRAHGY
jgi:hypothetical protein